MNCLVTKALSLISQVSVFSFQLKTFPDHYFHQNILTLTRDTFLKDNMLFIIRNA